MKILKDSLIVFLLFTITIIGCRKSDYLVEDEYEAITDNGSGIGTVTWTKDNSYLIEGLVFVNDGQVLTIEPGTVIRFKTGQGTDASALVVTRGGKIIAQGTAQEPIIFTVEGDDLEGSVPIDANGLWGGLIILGNAKLNNNSNEGYIEGIPISEPRSIYGGSDDTDNSGILEYVSIRHGGTNIGLNNEINGLTLGGVGSGTTIDFIEIISNNDDGIEAFGGTVDIKHAVVAYCGDDAFDFDEGYRGRGQYWFGLQNASNGDCFVEIDGGTYPITGQPYTDPVISNATFIGRGDNNGTCIRYSDNGAGKIYNSIFINQHEGVSIEYLTNSMDCHQQWSDNRLQIESNIFYDIAANDSTQVFTIFGDTPGSNELLSWKNYFNNGGNSIIDPGISFSPSHINPQPTSNVSDNIFVINDSWFDNVQYKGAFGSYNWTKGWTLLSQEGIIQ